MKKELIYCILIFSFGHIHAQKKTFKCEKVYDAVKLIDAEKYDEAIGMLRECEKIDPKEYTYPYEIALAYTYNKQYDKAIDQLLKIKNYENLRADYYQLLGNNYDYLEKPEKAIATYDEGLKKFPDAGRLYLERGVVFEFEKKYDEAIASYEKGMRVEPNYPSNYYRAAKIYLKTNDRLSGLIYGEIFMNLERTTSRTREMSEQLYEGYKSSMIFVSQDQKKTEFCPAVIDAEKYDKNKLLPLCMNFALSFVVAMMKHHEFNYDNLVQIRQDFLPEYQKLKLNNSPNVLLNYFKTMEDKKVFNAYNYYIFQAANKDAFAEWQTKNQDEYNHFEDWYTTTSNQLIID
jgi:hypothetical protein